MLFHLHYCIIIGLVAPYFAIFAVRPKRLEMNNGQSPMPAQLAIVETYVKFITKRSQISPNLFRTPETLGGFTTVLLCLVPSPRPFGVQAGTG